MRFRRQRCPCLGAAASQLCVCLSPSFPIQLWQAALGTLNPNPTDSCALYLNYATVAALPPRVSRHNSPSAAHFVTRLVRTCLPPGAQRCILVSAVGTGGSPGPAHVAPTCALHTGQQSQRPVIVPTPDLAAPRLCLSSRAGQPRVARLPCGGLHWPLPAAGSGAPSLCPAFQVVCEQQDVFASACALARAFPLFSRRSGTSRRPEKRTVAVEFFLVGQDNGPMEVSTLQVGV